MCWARRSLRRVGKRVRIEAAAGGLCRRGAAVRDRRLGWRRHRCCCGRFPSRRLGSCRHRWLRLDCNRRRFCLSRRNATCRGVENAKETPVWCRACRFRLSAFPLWLRRGGRCRHRFRGTGPRCRRGAAQLPHCRAEVPAQARLLARRRLRVGGRARLRKRTPSPARRRLRVGGRAKAGALATAGECALDTGGEAAAAGMPECFYGPRAATDSGCSARRT
jgi:hypothetical protein